MKKLADELAMQKKIRAGAENLLAVPEYRGNVRMSRLPLSNSF
jgi:hypothetical protein